MSDDILQARIDQAEANWHSCGQGDPELNSWGLFSYGDAPGGLGGGVGGFLWFPTRIEMLEFIASTLPYCPPGPISRDCEAVASETAAIIEQMKCGNVTDPVGIAELNKTLKHFSQITWTGTFRELLTEPHPYAVLVRTAFRSESHGQAESDDPVEAGEQASGAPIPPAEEPAFREFLGTWGS